MDKLEKFMCTEAGRLLGFILIIVLAAVLVKCGIGSAESVIPGAFTAYVALLNPQKHS